MSHASHGPAELGWRLAAGHSLSGTGALILAGWLIAFAALAALGYRRANAQHR